MGERTLELVESELDAARAAIERLERERAELRLRGCTLKIGDKIERNGRVFFVSEMRPTSSVGVPIVFGFPARKNGKPSKVQSYVGYADAVKVIEAA